MLNSELKVEVCDPSTSLRSVSG